MGWEEKSFYITVGIGAILFAWCVLDFEGLAAVVTSRTTAIAAPYVVGGALFLTIGITAWPMVSRILEENKNVALRTKLLDSGEKTTATIVKIEKTAFDVNESPLVIVTFETKDRKQGTFKTFAAKTDYKAKPGDKIDIICNPADPREVIPVARLE